MSRQGKFLVHCIEMYKIAKGLTGRQTLECFRKFGVIEYIVECYEALHTTGNEYIVHDIDKFIKARRPSAS
jgi:hypothetical protein